jgi:hypothetical protein
MYLLARVKEMPGDAARETRCRNAPAVCTGRSGTFIWMVYKSGASLVRVFAASVGRFWEAWLTWPKMIFKSSVINMPV